MLARNFTLQSMKKAARIQVCTIVRSNAKKNISRRAKSKKKNQQNNDQTTRRYRQTYKAVAPSTPFWVLCMTYLSRANDALQGASNQSCNGRDGEKLECKECKKV